MSGWADGRVILLAGLVSAHPLIRLSAQCPDGSPPPCSRAVPAAVNPRSVAVLNFRLLSRDSNDAYLAEGLADAITARLSQIERLDVASRTAVRLGRTPRAAYIVSGTMLRRNQRLSVTVELLRGASGRNAWSERFDRPDTSVLDLEQTIALRVASEILPSLSAAERTDLGGTPTAQPAAYDHFLRGSFFLARRSRPSAAQALDEFAEATRLDPGFAAAWARYSMATGIAWTRRTKSARHPRDSMLVRGLRAARRALALDSTESDAWAAMGYTWLLDLGHQGPEGDSGRAFLRRAIALDDRNAEAHHLLGWSLTGIGAFDPAEAAYRRALAIEPERSSTLRFLSNLMRSRNRLAEAQALCDSTLVVAPDFAEGWQCRGELAAQRGDLPLAARLLDSAVALGASPYNLALFNAALQRSDTAAMRRQLLMLDSIAGTGRLHPSDAVSIASLWMRAGDREAAIDRLERGHPASEVLRRLQTSTLLAPLLSSPRVQRLAR